LLIQTASGTVTSPALLLPDNALCGLLRGEGTRENDQDDAVRSRYSSSTSAGFVR